MVALLAFGSFWFWALMVLAAVLIILSIEMEKVTMATITMIVTVALLFFFSGERDAFHRLLAFVVENPVTTFIIAGSYFVTGIVWSFVKWYFFLLNEKRKFTEDKKRSSYNIPDAARQKGRILGWMTYWPFSLTWTIINDPVRKVFVYIHDRIQGSYQRMTDKMFHEFKDRK